MEQKTLHIAPIGVLRKDENGVRVELEPAYTPGLLGLELYSHVHILWWFDRRDNPEDRSRLQVRPPHRGTPGPMGVFASRSPSRPNPIALSTGRILNVDREQGILTLDWSDAEDGTPVLDIKPYTPSFDRIEHPGVPAWCSHWPRSSEESAEFDWDEVFS